MVCWIVDLDSMYHLAQQLISKWLERQIEEATVVHVEFFFGF